MPKEIFQKAKTNKNDEFYTSLVDIENEVKHYWNQLEGKKIWCNCDDEQWSNFYHFFTNQQYFHNFEVKFTSYEIDPINKNGLHKIESKNFIKKERDKVINTNEIWIDEDGFCKGDFRAKEQIPLWEWADIIITNPPFSLFREFVDTIMKYKKKFLIIGGQNAISYRDIFKWIKANKMWLGVNNKLTELQKLNENGEIEIISGKNSNLPNTCVWYTNLEHEKRNHPITLCDWDDEKFIKYENYDAYETVWLYGEPKRGRAEIPFTKNILSVPITFLHKFCPKQFKIIGGCSMDFEPTSFSKTIHLSSDSISINCKGVVYLKTNKNYAQYQNVDTGEYYAAPYARIFIQMTNEYYEELKEVFENE